MFFIFHPNPSQNCCKNFSVPLKMTKEDLLSCESCKAIMACKHISFSEQYFWSILANIYPCQIAICNDRLSNISSFWARYLWLVLYVFWLNVYNLCADHRSSNFSASWWKPDWPRNQNDNISAAELTMFWKVHRMGTMFCGRGNIFAVLLQHQQWWEWGYPVLSYMYKSDQTNKSIVGHITDQLF